LPGHTKKEGGMSNHGEWGWGWGEEGREMAMEVERKPSQIVTGGWKK